MVIRFRLQLALGFVLALSSLGAAAQSRGSFDRTLEVSGPVQLVVSSGSGSIDVRTGGDGIVEIHGEIRARSSWAEEVARIEADPPIEQDGNIIRVGPIDERDLRRNVSVSYEIVVPVDTSLVSHTGSGSQKIADIAGPVEVSSGSGSLEIGKIGASVDARTGSGSIAIDGVSGDLAARTGSGSIRAGGVAGAISAKSGSGSIELRQTGSGDVSVESGSGRVRIAGVRGALDVHTASGGIDVQGEMTGEWNLHASSGSITVDLPEGSSFELDAETNSGNIDVDHPVTVSGTISKKRIRGSVRGGGPRLSLHTASGSIRIE